MFFAHDLLWAMPPDGTTDNLTGASGPVFHSCACALCKSPRTANFDAQFRRVWPGGGCCRRIEENVDEFAPARPVSKLGNKERVCKKKKKKRE